MKDTTHTHFFVKLLGARDGFPENMTDEEERIMEDHFQYLLGQAEKKSVLLAGPCFADPGFGLVIVNEVDEDKAREIVESDPAIKGGVLSYEMSPMKISLMSKGIASE